MIKHVKNDRLYDELELERNQKEAEMLEEYSGRPIGILFFFAMLAAVGASAILSFIFS